MVPFWVEGADGPSKPWIPLWTSSTEPFLTAGKLQNERGAGEEILSLLDEAFQQQGRRPGRIEVSDPELQRLLSERLRESGIDVVVTKKLDGPERVLAAMEAHLGGADMPGALEVPGVTVESMRSFAQAARAFYDSAPWRHLSDRDVIEIRGGAPSGFRYAVVLGMGGATTGLGFFDDVQAFWDVMTGETATEKHWSLTYGSIRDLPRDDANLWVNQGLDVAGPDAYPVAFCVQSSNRVKRPSPRVLDFLTGLLKALAASGPTDFDEGRWKRTVDAITGPRDYELRLPFLLDPPSREELARRRILPDPRAFERFHFLFSSKLKEHTVESAEELEDLVQREIGDTPLDEIPYEPKDDRERAQQICFQAFDAWGRRQAQLAEQALSLDPDCVDALVLKAERTPYLDEKRKLYEQAAAGGERLLESEDLEDLQGDLWAYYPTRPYLRALHALAHVLDDLGEAPEATARYRRLLSLDQEDHQGIRYCLLTSLLTTGQFREAERHIKAHETPDECLWRYARALAAFGRYGDKKTSQKALEKAFTENPFAAARLLEIDAPDAPEPEIDDDADHCEHELLDAWSATPGAFEWLSERFEDAGFFE